MILPCILLFPPAGVAKTQLHTKHRTSVEEWLKTFCTLLQSGHSTCRNSDLGLGIRGFDNDYAFSYVFTSITLIDQLLCI